MHFAKPILIAAASVVAVSQTLPARAAEAPLAPAKLAPAGSPAQPAANAAHESFDPLLVLDDARSPETPPSPDTLRLQVHGELQLRVVQQTDVPLTPPPVDPGADSLGQRTALKHWHRITPRFDVRDDIAVIGQIDLPYGFFAGQRTRYVSSAHEPMDEHNPVRVDPRWLYVQANTPIGLFRLGQQGSHWGTGILANDGNHPRLFGDYARGDIVERLLFTTRPLGVDSPLAVLAIGELVFRDVQAELTDGDHAWQGTLGVLYGGHANELGASVTLRRQSREQESINEFTPYTEELDVSIFDVFARFAAPFPGGGGYAFGEAEAALWTGTTSFVRTPEFAALGEDEKVLSWGGQATLGVVRVARDGARRWGDLVVSVEWGYATGDADPNDGEQRRFHFQPNHKVGLVLFDHVLAWTTARAATAAGEATLVQRANPGLQFYPSEGGVFGATYLFPTVVVRPKHWLDLKAGMVVAQTTTDFVDPYRFGVQGQVANARGGNPSRHDLGLELDGGFAVRIGLAHAMTLQLGMQGGVLFPGHAFDDEQGRRMATQGLALGRFGLQY